MTGVQTCALPIYPVGFYPRFVGRPDAPGPEQALAAWLDGDIALTEAEATLHAEWLRIKSRWRVAQPHDVSPSFVVRCGGEVVARSTHAFWGGIHPFRAWQADESQTEWRDIALPSDLDAGCLRLEVTLTDVAGEPLADAGYAINVRRDSR